MGDKPLGRRDYDNEPNHRDILALRELIEERFRGLSKALDLQAKEYERRLTDLNHAHALAEQRNAEFIRGEVYHPAHREVRDLIDKLATKEVSLEGDLRLVEQRLASLTSSLLWLTRLLIGAAVGGIAALLLRPGLFT